MAKNRFKLQQMLDGVRASLTSANEKLATMYEDTTSTIEAREKQVLVVKDLEEREKGISAQIKAIDDEAAEKLKQQQPKPTAKTEKEKVLNAKAGLIRAVMTGKPVSPEIYAALSDGDTGLKGGQKILPSTMTTELVTEPMAKNPLRGVSTFTNITNLEVPKILFSLDDDDFLNKDTETAKEMKAETDVISFDRNKFKVFCDIPETVLNGTATNLVATVDAALESGLARKEKRVAFESTSPTEMSFYYKKDSVSVIKEVSGDTLYDAIIAALADLEDDYAENAKITMRKVDYFKIIKELANGNATLYTAQPEQILGAPVIFCDLATIPVVGDFNYSHFNYDENMLYDRDKNVKTGLESFVLTAWIDHKIKMKSAFRLATVTVTP
mgnify:CR=1 FL=1